MCTDSNWKFEFTLPEWRQRFALPAQIEREKYVTNWLRIQEFKGLRLSSTGCDERRPDDLAERYLATPTAQT